MSRGTLSDIGYKPRILDCKKRQSSLYSKLYCVRTKMSTIGDSRLNNSLLADKLNVDLPKVLFLVDVHFAFVVEVQKGMKCDDLLMFVLGVLGQFSEGQSLQPLFKEEQDVLVDFADHDFDIDFLSRQSHPQGRHGA